jgi:hypothetical protein
MHTHPVMSPHPRSERSLTVGGHFLPPREVFWTFPIFQRCCVYLMYECVALMR